MPRYFFDTYDGDRFVSGDVGLQLPDLAAARAEAQKALQDMARNAHPDGDQRTYAIMVKDEAGQVVARAALTLIVDLPEGCRLVRPGGTLGPVDLDWIGSELRAYYADILREPVPDKLLALVDQSLARRVFH